MIVTRHHLPRRTVLRGLGATISLPLLDSMIPAFARAAAPVRRLGVVYVGNGMNMAQWTPPAGGPLELSPIQQPLAPFRDRVLVLSGLACKQAAGNEVGPHARIQATWLTGARAKKTESVDVRAGVSMDQVAARAFGRETQLASLEMSLETSMLGTCAQGFSCVYNNTISWRDATLPLPMENSPRRVFERLFGTTESTEARVRLADIRRDRSILDSVTEKIAELQNRVGPRSRLRLAQYLDAVRDVERRIEKAEQQVAMELPVVEQPRGVPDSFSHYAELMFDLLALAYQCDLTRVSTFLMVKENSVVTFPETGIADPYHPLSHHGNNPEQMAKQGKINTFHMKTFAHFLEKMASTPDGDGSLLDHTLLLYGGGMSDSNLHYPFNVPTLVVGGSAVGIRGGRHIQYPEATSLANLELALLAKVGVPVDRFGDSDDVLAL